MKKTCRHTERRITINAFNWHTRLTALITKNNCTTIHTLVIMKGEHNGQAQANKTSNEYIHVVTTIGQTEKSQCVESNALEQETSNQGKSDKNRAETEAKNNRNVCTHNARRTEDACKPATHNKSKLTQNHCKSRFCKTCL